MLLGLYESQEFLIKILLNFKEYLKKHSLEVELLNLRSNLYLSDLQENHPDLLVIKPEGYEGLDPRELRSGGFYENVNEFGLNFTLHFMGFVRDLSELEIYCNLHGIYEHFLDFLHASSHKFEFRKKLKSSYSLSLNYYINATSNLNNNGFVRVTGSGNRAVLGLSQAYRANIQAIETKN
ncbi:hypothetical protein DB313_04830 (plasmid) [Borrelia turcica IST7]|uniref:Uncharacterized protein n=1 Tax=Borrelia turcica IST7 TaxID=1104446 RepID=A0A386PMN7_9SPIR|nr:DUF764 family protein [Borrelia turcica]AYE36826.1 hypothetical protein DB313_04830 [Borrelia turcica IST7]